MKFENTQVYNFEGAFRGMRIDFETLSSQEEFITWVLNSPSKNYRLRNGIYIVYFRDKEGNPKDIGYYHTKLEALNKVVEVKFNRLRCMIFENGLNNIMCKIYNNYLIFENGDIMSLRGNLLKGFVDRCGYREVTMNGRYERVHRMIAEAFLPNPKGLRDVNHIDGNKLNNDVQNLEWSSHSQNVLHAYQHNLTTKRVGENHHNHKLYNEAVRDIRNQIADCASTVEELATKYGVDKTTIRDVVRRKTWRHV